MEEKFLQVDEVSKSYGEKLSVLNQISLHIKQGEKIAIVGPSGAGKSTLLHIIGGLDAPTQGRVFYKGEDISKMKENKKGEFRNKQMGFVFQAHHLFKELTAIENVMVPCMVGGMSVKKAEQKAREKLLRLGLQKREKHFPSQLSGGEQQRVAMARALVQEPSILLADEPTGNLDSQNSQEIYNLLFEVSGQNLTVLMVTHNESLTRGFSRVLRMKDGHLVS